MYVTIKYKKRNEEKIMKLSELLLVELHDDELSEQGGVSYSGERLIDFLLEAELLHLIDEENGFEKINESLAAWGIKPIQFEETKKEVTLYYVYPETMIDDSEPAKVLTKAELIKTAKELAEAEAEETDEEPEVIESIFDAILYLEEKRDWLYIHTVTKEL